jgi:hypothetical protein
MDDLEDIRKRLEAVAVGYCEKGGTWDWDETMRHLTIYNPNGTKFATLHVESAH